MKTTIHPQYFADAQVICSSCGTTFKTGSTKQSISVEVCYKCHPFYTGEHRFLDRKGRVDNFQKKQAAAKQYQATLKKKKMGQKKEEKQTKTLRELLSEA